MPRPVYGAPNKHFGVPEYQFRHTKSLDFKTLCHSEMITQILIQLDWETFSAEQYFGQIPSPFQKKKKKVESVIMNWLW